MRIDPGPTSTNTRAPSRCIASIISANRTGLARWSPSRAAIAAGSAGWGAASRLEYTGRSGGSSEQLAARAGQRLARRGDQRGMEGGRDRQQPARDPSGRGQLESLACTAALGPAMTVCLGPFQLATCTPGTSRISRSTSSGPARRAAIAPAAPRPASRINRPRADDSSASAVALRTPAAWSATSSP